MRPPSRDPRPPSSRSLGYGRYLRIRASRRATAAPSSATTATRHGFSELCEWRVPSGSAPVDLRSDEDKSSLASILACCVTREMEIEARGAALTKERVTGMIYKQFR